MLASSRPSPSRRKFTVVLAAALIAAPVTMTTAATPAAAAAGWQAPEHLESFVDGGNHVVLAGSDSGGAAAIWVGSNEKIWARVYEPDEGWGYLANIGGGSSPQIAISAQGVAIAVWMGGGVGNYPVIASRYSSAAGWSTSEVIGVSGQPGGDLKLAGAAAGGVFAVWSTRVGGNWTLNTSIYLPGRGWATPETVPSIPGGSPGMGCAAIDDLGRGYIGWLVTNGTNLALYASTASFGVPYGYATAINAANASIAECVFADDDSAGATLAYSEVDWLSGQVLVKACTFWATECAGTQIVATVPGYGGRLSAASDAAGHRALAWFAKPAPSNASLYGTWAAYADPGARFGQAEAVGPDEGLFSIYSDSFPRLDMDEGGNAVLVVPTVRARPGGGAAIIGVGANRFTPGAGWGAFDILAGNQTSDCGETAAAATRGGAAFAAWRCWGPSVPNYAFVRRFAAAPALRITAPVEGQALESQAVRVAGSTDSAARLAVNGIVVAVDPDGAFAFTLELAPGNQTITAISTNADGDSAIVSVNVTIPDVPGDAIAELNALQAALEDAAARLDATEAALAVAQTALTAAEANLSVLSANGETTAEALAAALADLDAASASVAQLEDQATADRAAVEQQRAGLLTAQAAIATLQVSANASAERVAALERALSESQAALAAANASLAAADARAQGASAGADSAAQAAGLATLLAVVALGVAATGILLVLRGRTRREPES